MGEIKKREATAIINSLSGGVVPRIGVQHINVGRSEEIEAILGALEDVENGHSMVKFWIGDFGTGKSFIMHLLSTVAMSRDFVVANADFTPNNRLYSNKRQAVILYTSILDNLAIKTKPQGGALTNILEKWINKIVIEISKAEPEKSVDLNDIEFQKKVNVKIAESINELTDSGGYDFGYVINKYFEGYVNHDEYLLKSAVRWLRGEYTTKNEARKDLGTRVIIDDSNYYEMLKNFCRLFVSVGYSGLVINLDEAVNLYKISTSSMREKNYEKILTIYNDCMQGRIYHLFVNIAGTEKFLEDERRGLFSYKALKTRLEPNKYETHDFRDFTQPVIKLTPLDNDEIFVLLRKLKSIFEINCGRDIEIGESEIHMFMEELYNRPGAKEFLTPREVVRDFLNILNLIHQNPSLDKGVLFKNVEVKDERPDETTEFGIEEF